MMPPNRQNKSLLGGTQSFRSRTFMFLSGVSQRVLSGGSAKVAPIHMGDGGLLR
jgi:hypothetical protein